MLKLSKLVRKNIKELAAYSPGLFSGKYKMDANENPFDIPASLKKKMAAAVAGTRLNRYPDSGSRELRYVLAKRLGVRPGCLLFGNGSDEIITYLIQVFAGHGARIAMPRPTFDMYHIIGKINGAKPVEIPLDREFDLDLGKFLRAVKRATVKLTFIAYPNNPTGRLFSREKVLKIIRAAKGIVVIDEAYFDFSGRTFLKDMKKHKNLLILRTFSKSLSLAGLRLGYLIAPEPVIAVLNKARMPYNINSVTAKLAVLALRNDAAIKKSIKVVRQERDRMYRELKALYAVPESGANFFYIRLKDPEAAKKAFQRKGFSIRIFTRGVNRGYMRLTVGKPAENRAVMKLLRKGV